MLLRCPLGYKDVSNFSRLKLNYSTLKYIDLFFSGSADEDSGVGGSPGSGTRVPLHNCTMCSKKFSRADILRKHMKTHVNTSCTVCGQIFNDKVALGKHQVEVGHTQCIYK